MTRQASISELLESEHRWVDGQFQQFRQDLAEGRINKEPFQKAAKVLHRHIFIEEEILFPEVEAYGLVGPTTMMAHEHGAICRFLDEIQGLIQSNTSPGRIADAFNALHSLLGEHNIKEEQVLYPTADQLLSQDDVAKVVQQLKTAEAPAGWKCRAHRAGAA